MKDINNLIKFKISTIFLLFWIFMSFLKIFQSFKFIISFEEWLYWLNDELDKINELSIRFHGT